jgi:hypothetical protein
LDSFIVAPCPPEKTHRELLLSLASSLVFGGCFGGCFGGAMVVGLIVATNCYYLLWVLGLNRSIDYK